MALEVLLEECLKEPDAVRVGEAVEAEPNPCLRLGLDDERTRAPGRIRRHDTRSSQLPSERMQT